MKERKGGGGRGEECMITIPTYPSVRRYAIYLLLVCDAMRCHSDVQLSSRARRQS